MRKSIIPKKRRVAEKGSSDRKKDDGNETASTASRPVKQLEYDPFPGEDNSDEEEMLNRTKNIPLEWYEGMDHMGYDIDGNKIMKEIAPSALDQLLRDADDPNSWRRIKDTRNNREVVLTDNDLEVIRRIRTGLVPNSNYRFDDAIFFENDKPEDKIHPVYSDHQPKRRFMPSKWESMKIYRLVKLIKAGIIKPKPKKKPVTQQIETHDLWGNDIYTIHHETSQKNGPTPIPAPKMIPPSHAESYNPPPEYLLSEKEKQEWENLDEEDREHNFLPTKFSCLRHVPAYKNLIKERFERSLDLYLCPRVLKTRLNIDPESLLPELPSAKDLRPYPTRVAVEYVGHSDAIRSVSVSGCGKYVASAGEDGKVRVWDVLVGRCVCEWGGDKGVASALAWNPVYPVLCVGWEDECHVRMVEEEGERRQWEEKEEEGEGKFGEVMEWMKERNVEEGVWKWEGGSVVIKHVNRIQQIVWHKKGDYFAVVCPKAPSPSDQCLVHSLSKGVSMRPFKKALGGQSIQRVSFHPTKPYFLAATQKHLRLYDLQNRSLVKTLLSGMKWISSFTVHPQGEHIYAASFDSKSCWFDLELNNKPYKTFKYHTKGIRQVAYHQKYPLLASAGDDGHIHILHARVYDDYVTNPLIVPVNKLTGGHKIIQKYGVLDCAWHPRMPWIFTAGADGRLLLWT